MEWYFCQTISKLKLQCYTGRNQTKYCWINLWGKLFTLSTEERLMKTFLPTNIFYVGGFIFSVYLSMSLLTRWHLSHASGKIDKLAICINDGLRNCREEKDTVQLCWVIFLLKNHKLLSLHRTIATRSIFFQNFFQNFRSVYDHYEPTIICHIKLISLHFWKFKTTFQQGNEEKLC